MTAVKAWAEVAPADQRVGLGIRTEQISDTRSSTPGWGAGAGSIERHEFECPCGEGKIVEENDRTPGFREHDVWIDCDKCSTEWRFVAGLPIRGWRLEPMPVAETDEDTTTVE